MKIAFQKYKFKIKLREKTKPDIYPSFVFRSILGKELKNMSCLFKGRKCELCDLQMQCAYSFIFETPVDKNNEFLKGRNRASHPFILSIPEALNKEIEEINLELTLLGRSIDYLPYIYHSLKRAEKNGIFRSRVPFKIEDVSIDNKSILERDDKIEIINENKFWMLDNENGIHSKKQCSIQFVSPLRVKKKGRYISDVKYELLIESISRRIKILNSIYGSEKKSEDFNWNLLPKKVKTDLIWQDLKHYSSRQKNLMKLGGLIGTTIIEGEFNPFEESLLKAAELFHIGKNISFGLGKIKIS